MAGFNRDVNIELEDIDTDIDDFEDEYEDEEYEVPSPQRGGNARKGSPSKSPNKRPSRNSEDGEETFVRNKNEKSDNKTTVMIVVGVVAFVFIVGMFFFMSSAKKKKEAELLALQQAQEEQANTTGTASSSDVEPGIPSFYGVGEEQNDEYLYDSSLITKDLNGNQVPTSYVVVNSETVTDYINYKKYRSATGDGLEFYWLEAEYKGQPYKVQVPYSVYSKLDYSGITVVNMEVLELEDGSKMITYMSVKENAKSLLEQ